jgi:hypothetical protein
MENNKNHLYPVLLITGIAITIFSLWGIWVIISSFPATPHVTALARGGATESQAVPPTHDVPLVPCDPCDAMTSIHATQSDSQHK